MSRPRPPGPDPDTQTPLDLSALEDLVDSMGHNGRELVAKVIDVFTVHAPRSIQVMADGADPAAAYRAAHSLKSSASQLGALRLAELAKGLEHGLQSSPEADRSGQVDELAYELERVLAALAEFAARRSV